MVSDTPWNQFKDSDYTDTQYQKACLYCDPAVSTGDMPPKSGCKLPVLEPSGALNSNGLEAAYGSLQGSHGNKPSIPDSALSGVMSKLKGLYKQAGLKGLGPLKDDSTTNSMLQGDSLILLNSESKIPVYRLQVQTSNELPAHDMGYDKIKFNETAIQKGVHKLVGSFMWDESQSAHNKRVNPEMRGRKVAKVVNEGYCPNYGGYVDVEVFDDSFAKTMEQALDNRQRGLPVKEGPSTELNALDGKKYGDNNLEVTNFEYNGLVWTDNPRDTNLGVCSIINNSIENIKEDNLMVDELKINKEEYDALVLAKTEKEQEAERLKTELEEGKGLYTKGKEAFDKAMTELKDLKSQLIPVWESQEQEKATVVNSLLERIPEAEKEAKRKEFEGKELGDLKFIVNSLPLVGNGTQRGVQNGGVGSGRSQGETPMFDDPELQKQYDAAQKLPKIGSRYFKVGGSNNEEEE